MSALHTDAAGITRCWWCGEDPLYVNYHDNEWGHPRQADHALLEKLCLEGFQSGLAWITVLRKREHFREAFAGFVLDDLAKFTDRDVERLCQDPGIIRHRGKITAAINNARCACELRDQHGSLWAYLQRFVPEDHVRPTPKSVLRAVSPESAALAKELKRSGWRFVGPTTVYAFMQSIGMVNDHIVGCERAP